MMARKSKIDEDCEELSVVADPWNLKLKPAKMWQQYWGCEMRWHER